MTTRIRFTFWAALAGVLAVLLAGVVALGAVERSLEAVVDARLEQVLVDEVDATGVSEGCLQVKEQATARDDAVVAIADRSGVERCRSSAIAPSSRALGVTSGVASSRETRRIDAERWRVATAVREDAIVVAAELVEPGQAALRDARRAIWIAMAIGGLLAIGAGAFASLPATRRIDRMLRRIELAGRDVSGERRVGSVGGRDLDRAARSFDALLDDLHAANAAQRRLVADAAHQLRTPITSIRTNAQLLERDPTLTGDSRDMASRIARQSAAVATLVAGLVDVAAMPAWSRDAHEDVAFAAVVESAIDAARTRWPDARIESTLDASRGRVDAELLTRAVGNLLDNALVHGAEPVTVTLQGGRVGVEDAGAGWSVDEDLLLPFQPFASGAAGGTGLGLAFVDHVARAHGGTVQITRRRPPRIELDLSASLRAED
ncbi:MAG: sensor histidine kinase [Thermoleophilia bacterium]|nr:sensor histidine kinase [Thermoleophilia bacterium]